MFSYPIFSIILWLTTISRMSERFHLYLHTLFKCRNFMHVIVLIYYKSIWIEMNEWIEWIEQMWWIIGTYSSTHHFIIDLKIDDFPTLFWKYGCSYTRLSFQSSFGLDVERFGRTQLRQTKSFFFMNETRCCIFRHVTKLYLPLEKSSLALVKVMRHKFAIVIVILLLLSTLSTKNIHHCYCRFCHLLPSLHLILIIIFICFLPFFVMFFSRLFYFVNHQLPVAVWTFQCCIIMNNNWWTG